MGDLVTMLFVVIAAIMVVVFTVSLVIDLAKRKPLFSSLKKWFVGVIDALSGV